MSCLRSEPKAAPGSWLKWDGLHFTFFENRYVLREHLEKMTLSHLDKSLTDPRSQTLWVPTQAGQARKGPLSSQAKSEKDPTAGKLKSTMTSTSAKP